MCTVLLPPGVNPIAVNKYININFLFCFTGGLRKKKEKKPLILISFTFVQKPGTLKPLHKNVQRPFFFHFPSWFLIFLDNPWIKRKFAEVWGKVFPL